MEIPRSFILILAVALGGLPGCTVTDDSQANLNQSQDNAEKGKPQDSAVARPAEETPSKESATPEAEVADPGPVDWSGFQERVKSYDKLRDRIQKETPKVGKKADPEEIERHREVLAKAVVSARTPADQGDIFGDAEPYFKRLVQSTLAGPAGKDSKAMATDDEHKPEFTPQVNTPYPSSQPLSTMPPRLLQQLPELPQEMEYRLVGQSLILFDARANLIVDFVPNAIGRR